MSSAKPILGYPSYSAAVVALRAAGLPTAAIAARLGIKHASVFEPKPAEVYAWSVQ